MFVVLLGLVMRAAGAAADSPQQQQTARSEPRTAAADDLSSCMARVTALEAVVAQLDGVVRQMKADHAAAIDELRDTAAALVKQMGATRPATIQAMQSNITEPTGDTGASTPENQRRLSATPTYAAMPAWQVHEFPNGATCSLGSRMRLLPKNRVGDGLSWSVSNADAASDLSLVTLGGTSHWATSDVQSMPYPLKVVHDASCSNAPTLTLQLGTNVAGSLSVNGKNIVSALHDAGPTQDLLHSWRVTSNAALVSNANPVLTRFQRGGAADAYLPIAVTTREIVKMTFFRGPAHVSSTFAAHTHIGFSVASDLTSGFVDSTDVIFWFNHASNNVASDGVRTKCNEGEIYHGTAVNTDAGAPADDNHLTDSDEGDIYSIVHAGTTVSFYAHKYNNGQTPLRTCTVSSGNVYYGRILSYTSGTEWVVPQVTYA